jgi:hypothetical protein
LKSVGRSSKCGGRAFKAEELYKEFAAGSKRSLCLKQGHSNRLQLFRYH